MSFVVTIDGPAGAGKSTTARAVAARLGLLYVDTGALYRAFALKARNAGIPIDDDAALERCGRALDLVLSGSAEAPRVWLEGVDVSEETRTGAGRRRARDRPRAPAFPGPGGTGGPRRARRLGEIVGAYYSVARFLPSGCFPALTGWEVRGRERTPRHGGLIVASNHISFWDPPFIGSALPREMHFLAKEELFRTLGLGPLIRGLKAIPIRRGVADMRGRARAMATPKRGEAVLMVPEGSRM